jgi:hypothetical protein
MSTLRVGSQHWLVGKTPNTIALWQVDELEWCPPHQRLIVRMRDDDGNELSLTPRELAINRG